MVDKQTFTDAAAGWTPIVILDGGVGDDEVEIGERFRLPSMPTQADAWAAAKEAMQTADGAIGCTVERSNRAPMSTQCAPRVGRRRYCVQYMVDNVAKSSPWFHSEVHAERALATLRQRYGSAIIYVD